MHTSNTARRVLPIAAVFATSLGLFGFSPGIAKQAVDVGDLDVRGVEARRVRHEGRDAIRLIESDGGRRGGLAIVRGMTFRDGVIDVDVAGRRGPYAIDDDRGFVGVAFRIAGEPARFEYIYLRPDNGRAEDQLQRNHATQYASHPDFPWPLLRKEFPGKYESYVDLQPGVWTAMRIVVEGSRARLFVHGATQPTLVVNDLKLSPATGGIGFWIGAGSEAFFANLRLSSTQASRE